MIEARDDRPLIVTAWLDAQSQRELDELRRVHFPPGRNHLAAHVTLFHHLAACGSAQVRAVLAEASGRLPLDGHTGPIRNLGRGVAVGIDCPALVDLRRWIAARVPGPLTRQDEAWRWPHATVQNKVDPDRARLLAESLAATETPRPLRIVGLGLWRYEGGPWAHLATYPPAASGTATGNCDG